MYRLRVLKLVQNAYTGQVAYEEGAYRLLRLTSRVRTLTGFSSPFGFTIVQSDILLVGSAIRKMY